MPDITLHFDGTTECRGKNGWFQLREADMACYATLSSPSGYAVYINLYSKVRGVYPPIWMHLTNPDELKTLICGLSKVYAQMLTCREEESIREV